jgi:hypothetical protein
MRKRNGKTRKSVTSNPTEFWNTIQNLGPRREKTSIPMEVLLSDGTTTYDEKTILNTWKDKFENLYNINGDYDNEFLETIIEGRRQYDPFEGDLNDQSVMTANITRKEIETAINKAKLRKATGEDNDCRRRPPGVLMTELPAGRSTSKHFAKFG